MSIRVYRPLSVEAGRPPYRPLIFEVGVGYYQAERFVRDNNLEFWSNPSDLKYVGTFIKEVCEKENNGSVFFLNSGEHFVKYDENRNTFFVREL